jgi:hypothetical protein
VRLPDQGENAAAHIGKAGIVCLGHGLCLMQGTIDTAIVIMPFVREKVRHCVILVTCDH